MATFIVRLAAGDPPDGATTVAVKDLIDMAGTVTSCGSNAVAAMAQPATTDAACLTGTRAAEKEGRAVIVGKTNLHELAFGVSGVNPWYGTPVNPLDPALVPGGSSSGSAVALATGEADVAFGSDTGGSIRIPAACCGVVGLKTTRGRIELDGVAALAPSLDTVGPMGATVEATGLGMELLEPGFAWRRCRPATRIGRVRLPAAGWIDRAIDGALSAWVSSQGVDGSGAGRKVVDIELPGWGRATEAVGLILVAEAWSVHRTLWEDHSEDLSPEVAQRLEMGSLISADEVASAWEEARRWADEVAKVFATVDLLALPVLAAAPPPLEEAASVAAIRHTAPWNLAGVPALAMPVGDGPVPASLQLVGRRNSEEMILATALGFESIAEA